LNLAPVSWCGPLFAIPCVTDFSLSLCGRMLSCGPVGYRRLLRGAESSRRAKKRRFNSTDFTLFPAAKRTVSVLFERTFEVTGCYQAQISSPNFVSLCAIIHGKRRTHADNGTPVLYSIFSISSSDG
jgi:hypothetical protein